MPFNDGIPRTHCFSLTDIHDFERCVFRFLVRHHLERKSEIDDSSAKMALGTLLDESIKLFHLQTSSLDDPDSISYIVKGAYRHIKQSVEEKGDKSFYAKHIQFMNDAMVDQATAIFKDYYTKLDGKIKKSLGKVPFCEYIIERNGKRIKLWGGPDTFEMGEDGIPEVVDYKYHEDPTEGASRLDMDLMPKMYMLLCRKTLQDKGYSKARFVVRQWTDPSNTSLVEEFDFASLDAIADLIGQKIEPILQNRDVSFCEKGWCRACKSEKRQEYLKELEEKKFITLNQDLLFAP